MDRTHLNLNTQIKKEGVLNAHDLSGIMKSQNKVEGSLNMDFNILNKEGPSDESMKVKFVITYNCMEDPHCF